MKKHWFVLLVMLVICLVPIHSEAATFKDVKASHALQLEIDYLVEKGVISGYSDGTFKPNETIAKKHVAAMLVKALQLPTDNVQNPGYKDIPITHRYYNEIAAAYTAGLFGKADYFKPDATISRAFMAQLLTKAFSLQQMGAAIWFQDMKETSTYYKAVQAVATNGIANGSLTKGYYLHFLPNKALTRAHFSAFLARAMTLNSGEYFAERGYDYVYTYSNGHEQTYYYESNDQYDDYYWVAYDAETKEIADISVYGMQDYMWFEGMPNSDTGVFVTYPFTIGMKYNFLKDDAMPAGKQSILSTNTTMTVQGKRFINVVVIEEQFYETVMERKQLAFQRIYIAEGYGIIRAETGLVGKKATWWRELKKRVRSE